MATNFKTTASLSFELDGKALQNSVSKAQKILNQFENSSLNIEVDTTDLNKLIKNIEQIQAAILTMLNRFSNIKKINIDLNLDKMKDTIKEAIQEAFSGALINVQKNVKGAVESTSKATLSKPIKISPIKASLDDLAAILAGPQIKGRVGAGLGGNFASQSDSVKFGAAIKEYSDKSNQLIRSIENLAKVFSDRRITSNDAREQFRARREAAVGQDDFRFLPELVKDLNKTDLFDLKRFRSLALSLSIEIEKELSNPNITKSFEATLRNALKNVFDTVQSVDIKTSEIRQKDVLDKRNQKAIDSFRNAYERIETARDDLRKAVSSAIANSSNDELNQVLKRYERINQTAINALEDNRRAQDLFKSQEAAAGQSFTNNIQVYSKQLQAQSDVLKKQISGLSNVSVKNTILQDLRQLSSTVDNPLNTLLNKDASSVADKEKAVNDLLMIRERIYGEVQRIAEEAETKLESNVAKEKQRGVNLGKTAVQLASTLSILDEQILASNKLIDNQYVLIDTQKGINFLKNQEDTLIQKIVAGQSEIKEARSVQRINDEDNKIIENTFRRAKRVRSELSQFSSAFQQFAAQSAQSFALTGGAVDESFLAQYNSFQNGVKNRRQAIIKSIGELRSAVDNQLVNLNNSFLNRTGAFSGLDDTQATDLLNTRTIAIQRSFQDQVREINKESKLFENSIKATSVSVNDLYLSGKRLKTLQQELDNADKSALKLGGAVDKLVSSRLFSGKFDISSSSDLLALREDINLLNSATDSSFQRLTMLRRMFKDLTGVEFDNSQAVNALDESYQVLAQRILSIQKTTQDGVQFRVDSSSAIAEVNILNKMLEEATTSSLKPLNVSSFAIEFNQIQADILGTNEQVLAASDSFAKLKQSVSSNINRLVATQEKLNAVRAALGGLNPEMESLFSNNEIQIRSLKQLDVEFKKQESNIRSRTKQVKDYYSTFEKGSGILDSAQKDLIKVNDAYRAFAQIQASRANPNATSGLGILAEDANLLTSSLNNAKKKLLELTDLFSRGSGGLTPERFIATGGSDQELSDLAKRIIDLKAEINRGVQFRINNADALDRIDVVTSALDKARKTSLGTSNDVSKLSFTFALLQQEIFGTKDQVLEANTGFKELKATLNSKIKSLLSANEAYKLVISKGYQLSSSDQALYDANLQLLDSYRLLQNEVEKQTKLFDYQNKSVQRYFELLAAGRSSVDSIGISLGKMEITLSRVNDLFTSGRQGGSLSIAGGAGGLEELSFSIKNFESDLTSSRKKLNELKSTFFELSEGKSLTQILNAPNANREVAELAALIVDLEKRLDNKLKIQIDNAEAFSAVNLLNDELDKAVTSSLKGIGKSTGFRNVLDKTKQDLFNSSNLNQGLSLIDEFNTNKKAIDQQVKALTEANVAFDNARSATGRLTAAQERLYVSNLNQLDVLRQLQADYFKLSVSVKAQESFIKASTDQFERAAKLMIDGKRAAQNFSLATDSIANSIGKIDASNFSSFVYLVDDLDKEFDSVKKNFLELNKVFNQLSKGRSLEDVLNSNNVSDELKIVADSLSNLKNEFEKGVELRLNQADFLAEVRQLQKATEDVISKSLKNRGVASRGQTDLAQINVDIKSKDANVVVEAADNFNRLKNDVGASIRELIQVERQFKSLAEAQGGLTTVQEKLRDSSAKELEDLRKLNNELNKNNAIIQQRDQIAKNSAKTFSFYSTELSEQIKSNFRYANAIGVTTTALFALRTAFTDLIEESRAFARSLTVVQSVNLSTAQSAELLQRRTRESAVAFGQSLSNVLEVQKQFGSAGFSLEESLKGLDSTLALINSTSAGAESVARSVAGIYRVFGDQLRSTYGEMRAFSSIADTLTSVYRNHQAELEEIVNGMKFAGAAAASSGFSFEETSAYLAVLNDNLIKGGTAGRTLQVIFAQMANKASTFKDAFGVVLDPKQTLSDQFLSLLEQMNLRLKSGSLTVQELEKRFKFFGLRGARGFITLTEKFEDLRKALNNTQQGARGVANELSEVVKQQLANRFDRAKQALLDFARQGLEPIAFFLGIVSEALLGLRNIFAQFPIISKVVATIVILTAAISTLAISVTAVTVLFVTGIKTLKDQTIALYDNTKAWIANASAQRSAAQAAAVSNTATSATTSANAAQVGGKNGQRALGSVAGASLGLVGALIAGLEGAGTVIVTVLGAIGGFFLTIKGIIVASVLAIAGALLFFTDVGKKIREGFGSVVDKLRDFFKTSQGLRDEIQQIAAKATETGRESQRATELQRELDQLEQLAKTSAITQEALGQQVREAFNKAGTTIVDTTKIALMSNEQLANSFKNLKKEAEAIIALNNKVNQNKGIDASLDIIRKTAQSAEKTIGGGFFEPDFFNQYQQYQDLLKQRDALRERIGKGQDIKTGFDQKKFGEDVKNLDKINKKLGEFGKRVNDFSQIRIEGVNAIESLTALTPETRAGLIKELDSGLEDVINNSFDPSKFKSTKAGQLLWQQTFMEFAKEIKKNGGYLSDSIQAELERASGDASKFVNTNAFQDISARNHLELTRRFDKAVEGARNGAKELIGLIRDQQKLALGVTLPDVLPIDKFEESYQIFRDFRMEFSQPFSKKAFQSLNTQFEDLFRYTDNQEKAVGEARKAIDELIVARQKLGKTATSKELADTFGETLSQNNFSLNIDTTAKQFRQVLLGELNQGRLGNLLGNKELGLNIDPRTITLLSKVAKEGKQAEEQAKALDDVVKQITDKIFTQEDGGIIFDVIGDFEAAQVQGQKLADIIRIIGDSSAKLNKGSILNDFITALTNANNQQTIISNQNKLINDQLKVSKIAVAEKAALNPLRQLDNALALLEQRKIVLNTSLDLNKVREEREKLVNQLTGDPKEDDARRKRIKELVDAEKEVIELDGDILLARKKIAQFEVKARNEIILANQATQETAKFLLGNLGLKRSEAKLQEQILKAKIRELDIDELLEKGAGGRIEKRAAAIKEINSLLQKQLQLTNDFKNEIANDTFDIFDTLNKAKTLLSPNQKVSVLVGFDDRQLAAAAKLNRISQQLREAEKLRLDDSVQYQSKVIALRKQQIDLLGKQLEDIEKIKKAAKELDDLTDRRIEALKALRKALQEIRKPLEEGFTEATSIVNSDLQKLLNLASASGQNLERAFTNPKLVVDDFVKAVKEGRANINGLDSDSRKFAESLSKNFAEEKSAVKEIQGLQVERFRLLEKQLDLARKAGDFDAVDKASGQLLSLGQDLFGADPDQRIQFLREYNKLQEELLKERANAVEELKIKFSIINKDDFVKQVYVIKDALRDAIEQLSSFADVSEPIASILDGALKGDINLRSKEFTIEVNAQLDRFESLINTLNDTIGRLEKGPSGKNTNPIGGFDFIPDEYFSDRLKYYGDLGRQAATNFTESLQQAFSRGAAVSDASTLASGIVNDSVLNKAKEVIKDKIDNAGSSTILDSIVGTDDKQIRKTQEELDKFLEKLKTNIDFRTVFANEFSELDKVFLANSRGIPRLAKKMFLNISSGIKTAIADGLNFAYNKFTAVFQNLFDLSFAFENVEIFENFIDQLKQIDADFFSSAFDIQETLRRNESSYYDYINSIQDAEQNRIKARIEAEKQYREELNKTADVFKETISKSISEIADFGDFDLNSFFGFGDIGTNLTLLGGGVSTLVKSSLTRDVGQSALNDIDFVALKDTMKSVEEKQIDATEDFVKGIEAFKSHVDEFSKVVNEIPQAIESGMASAIQAAQGGVSSANTSATEATKTDVQKTQGNPFAKDIVFEMAAISAEIFGKIALTVITKSIGFIANLILTLGSQILQNGGTKVVKFINKFIQELPTVITKFARDFTESVPVIIDAFVEGLPTIVDSLVKSLPVVVQSLITELIQNGPTIAKTLLTGVVEIVTELTDVLAKNSAGLVTLQTQLIGLVIQSIPLIIQGIVTGISSNIDTIVIALFKTYLYLQFGLLYDLITSVINRFNPLFQIKSFGESVISKIPNSFHSGGVIPGNQRDILINAQSGEGVLSRMGLQTLGGAGALNALNNGINPYAGNLNSYGNVPTGGYNNSSTVNNNNSRTTNYNITVNSSGNVKQDAKTLYKEIKRIDSNNRSDRK